ncbi:hypothetical protein [Streptomyces sp. NPDC020917]|uniref:hypothetical protein n=1 Tax=Streptomyces sp. NPDC020917 TaxID=3365102 RepID=UPI003793CE03
MAEEPDAQEGAEAPAEVVSAQDGRGRRRPWPWVVGTAAVTCAVAALVLQAVGYGHTKAPDLHGYHAESPCYGDNLKPLTDAFRSDDAGATPAQLQSGSALDAAQCTLTASGPISTEFKGQYAVTVTAELHKKTDPTAEFEDRVRAHTQVDPYSMAGSADTGRSTAVPGLGDEAFLLTRQDDRLTLLVRHGGAVFTVDLSALQQPVNVEDPPTGADGYPARLPSLDRFVPAMRQSVVRVMAALSK